MVHMDVGGKVYTIVDPETNNEFNTITKSMEALKAREARAAEFGDGEGSSSKNAGEKDHWKVVVLEAAAAAAIAQKKRNYCFI